jgi:hypothetical protein
MNDSNTMTAFNRLEVAALQSIAAVYPASEFQLARLFEACAAIKRTNTVRGFLTELILQRRAFAPIKFRSPLGEAWISVKGLRFGICCLVFLTEGYPTLLEGYAVGAEDTSTIDFNSVAFGVRSAPPTSEDNIELDI